MRKARFGRDYVARMEGKGPEIAQKYEEFLQRKLWYYMRKYNLTQRELSAMMGYADNYLSGVLGNYVHRNFTVESLFKLCYALNITPAEFFDDSVSMFSQEEDVLLESIIFEAKNLSKEDKELILYLMRRLIHIKS